MLQTPSVLPSWWSVGIGAETFVESMRPSANLRGHPTFHLKHEVLHLEMLSRLFERAVS